MRVRWAVGPAVLLALLAGCSSEEEEPGAEPSPPVATTVTTSASAESPTVSSAAASSTAATSTAATSPAAESTGPPPTSGPVHRLGDRVRLVSGSRMAVFTWQRVRRPGGPAAGAWWAADIEFCLTRSFGNHFREPIRYIRASLRAELSDGRLLTPEADARKSDEVYAQDIPVVAGKCRRGELVFDVPAGEAPTYLTVTYSPFSYVRWQLS